MDSKKIKGIDYYIYSDKFEFYKYHLGGEYKDWRDDSVVAGNWVQTDLGGITKCLKIGKVGKYKTVTTIVGTYRPDLQDHKMDNTVRVNHWRFVAKDGSQKLATDKKFSRKDKAFARLTMLGKDETEAFKKINPDAKSEIYIKQRISIITNKKGYDSYMSDQFTKLLVEEEMTKKWGLRILKKIAEDKLSPAGVRKEIVDDILEDLGEQRKGVKQIETTSWYAKAKISDGEIEKVQEIGETKKEEKLLKNSLKEPLRADNEV